MSDADAIRGYAQMMITGVAKAIKLRTDLIVRGNFRDRSRVEKRLSSCMLSSPPIYSIGSALLEHRRKVRLRRRAMGILCIPRSLCARVESTQHSRFVRMYQVVRLSGASCGHMCFLRGSHGCMFIMWAHRESGERGESLCGLALNGIFLESNY